MSLQPLSDLEEFYNEDDPWGYENNPDDLNRKEILSSELIKLATPRRVLDIGCGHGFVTRDLPGDNIVGVDISKKAIGHAQKTSVKNNIKYVCADMFDLASMKLPYKKFDMIIITGVLYPQYIGNARTTIYEIVDELLEDNGIVISVHIGSWYTSRFPYVLLRDTVYRYREYQHFLEVYKKI